MIKNPGVTLVAVISIALGIAANTSVFTMVNAVLFKPMPVKNPDQLVALYTLRPESQYPGGFSYPLYVDYRDNNEVFDEIFGHYSYPISMKMGTGQAELIWGELVTGNYFSGLGLETSAGRFFTPEEDKVEGANPLAVISHQFWVKRFNSSPNAIGQVVKFNGHDFTIIGVAAKGFSGTRLFGFIPDVWMPLTMHAQLIRNDATRFQNRGNQWLNVNGRLKPGVTIEQATAAMNTYASQLAEEYPQTDSNMTIGMVEGGVKTQPVISTMGFIPIVSALLMLAVGLVLLIACANVANLMLARASSRRREIAIRLAIGASRFRLIRQLLTESIMVSLIGGSIGLLLTLWLSEVIKLAVPQLDFATVDTEYDFSLDHRILGFTLLASIITGIIFGLLPAMQASKPDLVPVLKGESQAITFKLRRLNLRSLLVVSQIALSLILMIGAGLCIKSMNNASEMNPGFDTDKILMASVDLDLQGYDQAKGINFYKQIQNRLKSLSGVESASIAYPLPLDESTSGTAITIEGRVPGTENERLGVMYSVVGPDYFETMNTPIVQGRAFTEFDDSNAPLVAIVNETMARHYWPGEDPIGKRLQLGRKNSPYVQIVGIAKDGKYISMGESQTDYMFIPFLQNYGGRMRLVARTSGNPENLVAGIRAEVRALDSELPVFGVKTIPQYLYRVLSGPKTIAALVSVLGLLALLLAMVGLYSVMSYTVAQRTQEIGIRMALGAGSREVLALVVKQGILLALIGVAIGLAGAFALTRFMSSVLYGVSTTDFTTFAITSVLLTVVALGASYLPARRATRVDPMVALRYQ
jgi:predicted permease